MRSMFRIAATLLTILAIQGCGMMRPQATGTKSATAEHSTGAPLSVESRNGSVDVIADTAVSEVQISAKITCEGDTQAEADQRLTAALLTVERGTDHKLTIKPVFPGGERGNDGADITIHLPDADGVQVHTSNGSISISALKGAAVLDTSNASVTLTDHAGNATVNTSNGGVKVQRCGIL